MWDFIRRRKPAPAPHDCVHNINAWREYVLSELETVYKQILAELSVTDRESLAKLESIISRYEAVEERVDSALNLMKAEIQAFEKLSMGNGVKWELVPDYNPTTKNLTFRLEAVSNE